MAIGTPVDLGHNSRTGNFNSVTLTLGTGASVGTKVIVGAASGAGAGNTVTFSDSKGNVWTTDVQYTALDPGVAVGSSDITVALVSGDTITATWALTTNTDYFIAAFSVSGLQTGLGTGTPSTASGSAGWSTGNMTTTNPNEIIVGFAIRGAATTETPDSGYTELYDFNDGSRTLAGVYQIVAATGTYNAGGTWVAGGVNKGAGATYQAPPSLIIQPLEIILQTVKRAAFF